MESLDKKGETEEDGELEAAYSAGDLGCGGRACIRAGPENQRYE